MAVIKLHYMESTSVHVKMNISLLKIWSNRFPYLYLGMQFLNLAPGGVPDSLAVTFGRNKKNVKIPLVTFNLYDHTTFISAVLYDPIVENVITIIRQKNSMNDIVPLSECSPVCIAGIFSSNTRNAMAPAVRAITNI